MKYVVTSSGDAGDDVAAAVDNDEDRANVLASHVTLGMMRAFLQRCDEVGLPDEVFVHPGMRFGEYCGVPNAGFEVFETLHASREDTEARTRELIAQGG